MTIILNGQRRILDAVSEQTIVKLVEALDLQADRVAIERNGLIVPRASWPETRLAEGDRVEIVQFVGGGAPVSCSRSCSHRSP